MSAATIKHLDPTQVELEISIEKEELAAARDRAFKELVKNVRIPGFRPGKAPRRIFEAQYGTAGIEERAMDAVVPAAYGKALQENELQPLDQPQMELLPEEEGQPLRLRATVSIRPHFELHAYKGIEVEGPAIVISESDVERALQSLRKESATLLPVARPVQLGDVPTIDYEGKIDGVPFDGGQAEGQSVEIAEERFIPGFASGIVGMSAGETKAVEAHFPPDYSTAELAGKTAVFAVTVLENKVAELPELDDELAKRFGGDQATVASLQDELRNRLEAGARQNQRRAVTGPLLEKLTAAHEVPLPAILVDRESEHLYDEAKGYIDRSGVAWETYLQEQGKTEDDLRAQYRSDAEKRVKTSLLIEAIAKAENITATSADVEAEVAALSRQYGQPREAILEMLRSNFDALVDGIVRTKTLEYLLDHASVRETAEPPSASYSETESASQA